MKPVLTISIAAYNVEKYINKTLDSLTVDALNGKIEVLIVDDGSKDRTSAIAKRYEEIYPNIFKLISKKNGGYGSTINTGTRYAHGKYFKQLDGDDWFEKENLESFVTHLGNVDADYILTDYLEVYEDETDRKELVSVKNMKPYKEYAFSEFDQENDLAMHALTVKTEILKNNQIIIDEHCFYTDVEYDLYPLPYVEKLLYIPMAIYCYRLGRTGQSMELKSSVRNYRDHERVCQSLLHFLDQRNDWDSIADGIYKKAYIEKRLKEMVKRQYFLYVLKKYDAKVKGEYLAFDSFVMKHRQEWGTCVKKEFSIKLSLASGGIFYPAVCVVNNIRFAKKLK